MCLFKATKFSVICYSGYWKLIQLFKRATQTKTVKRRAKPTDHLKTYCPTQGRRIEF